MASTGLKKRRLDDLEHRVGNIEHGFDGLHTRVGTLGAGRGPHPPQSGPLPARSNKSCSLRWTRKRPWNSHRVGSRTPGMPTCGKYVKEIKHRRLKISYRKCEQAKLAQTYWTMTPNYEHNPYRLLELFRKFLTVANGHDLAWNCSVPPPGGGIQCLCCNTTSRYNIGR